MLLEEVNILWIKSLNGEIIIINMAKMIDKL